jgi:heterodisulfide reductase subunit D
VVPPEFKAELREREFRASAEAGVPTFASIFHDCHRELINYQPQVSFELITFMEVIGESMGIHVPDLYKRLQLTNRHDHRRQRRSDCRALPRFGYSPRRADAGYGRRRLTA